MTITPRNNTNYLFAFFAGLFCALSGLAIFTEQYFLIAIPFALLLFYDGWQHRDLVFYLLIAALPFSFEYNFTAGLGTDIPDEFLMLLVTILFLAYCIYSPRAIGKEILQHPLFLCLAALLGWTFICIIFSADKQVAIKYILAKGWYAGAFVIAPLVLFNDKRKIVKAAIVFTGSMLLVMFIALFRHYGEGFSFAMINEAVSPFFRNHVNYSAMLVCVLPVLAAFVLLNKNRNQRLLLVILIIISLLALFLSYARGAWLALLAGVVAAWLLKKRLLFYSYIAVVILMTVLVFWFKSNDRYLAFANDYKTTIFHKDFSEHLIATYKLKDLSTAERFYRWIAGVRMIKDNGLTGIGPNNFYPAYKTYTIPAFKTWVSDNPEHSTVHNYFLLTTVEQGIPGLILLLILLGTMLYYAQSLYTKVTDTFYRTVAAVSAVMLTMIMVLNMLSDLVETDKIGSLFFLCFSMLLVTDRNSKAFNTKN